MPKKFVGQNSKAVAAKAKKNERAEAEKARIDAALEDAKWKDDDKANARKKDRKEEREGKKQEALLKKQERQRLLDEENASLKSVKPTKDAKVTRDQIRRETEKQKVAALNDKKEDKMAQEDLLIENLNRLEIEGDQARNVDEALAVLNGPGKLEKHPEKRMKAAYEEFEGERLPILKQENPNLRLSQLKQMLRKEWMKHPSNPFNQRITDYNNKV